MIKKRDLKNGFGVVNILLNILKYLIFINLLYEII